MSFLAPPHTCTASPCPAPETRQPTADPRARLTLPAAQTNPTVRHFYQALSQGQPWDDLSAWEAFQRSHASMSETNAASTPPGAPQQAFNPSQQGFTPTPQRGFGPGSDVKPAAVPAWAAPADPQNGEPPQPTQQLGQCFRWVPGLPAPCCCCCSIAVAAAVAAAQHLGLLM